MDLNGPPPVIGCLCDAHEPRIYGDLRFMGTRHPVPDLSHSGTTPVLGVVRGGGSICPLMLALYDSYTEGILSWHLAAHL